MTNRMLKIVAVVGLVAFVFTTWHLAQAKEWTIKKSDVPKAALARVEKAYPKATIIKVEAEDEDGMRLYEVKLKHKGQEREVTVSPNGVLVEIETVVAKEDLPKAVAKALAKAAKGGKIQKIEKGEVLAVVKLVKLKRPQVSYEAKFVKDGKRVEIEFAPNGKILETETEPIKKSTKKDDDDDDD